MKPLIGISACVKPIPGEDIPFHAASEAYLRAAADGAQGLPVILPSFGAALDIKATLAALDGLLLTGSKSNVDPSHYDGIASAPGTPQDRQRDATTLPLIRAALDEGVPLLAICRGFQELNVALGGTLHQKVQEVPGKMDHRPDPKKPNEVQWGPAHPISLTPGGMLARLNGGADHVIVNSLHGQGIDRLAPGLAVEAEAPDGLIEAVRVPDSGNFSLGVQWHPEWRFAENPLSRAIFAAFGQAVAERRRRRGS